MISSETNKVQYNCDGSVEDFAFPYKIFDDDDITVILTDASGVESTLVISTNYTVAADRGDYSNGCTVTTRGSASPYASGNKITIYRNLSFLQSSDYINNDSLDANTVEDDFDRMVIYLLQVKEQIDRMVKAAVSDESVDLTLPTKATRASSLFGWDADGKPIASAGGASAAVSTWAATFVDDATAADARTTLDVYSQAEVDALVDSAEEATFIDGQTVDAGVSVGDPVFKNTTKETVDLCDAADWTDDAEITTALESSETILNAALRLTKDGGAAVLASCYKTQPGTLDFTSKDLYFYLYIDDAATLAKLAATDGVTIRYGSDDSNYYEWTVDRSELAVGWNTLGPFDTDNEDSTTGAPVIASMDYLYIGLTTNAASDTWAAGKVIMDHVFLASDVEWQLATSSTPGPQGIFVGSGKVVFAGYTDQLSNLLPGQVYWMDSSGKKTPLQGQAYANIKLGYALSDTEFVVGIAAEGNSTMPTASLGNGGVVKGYYMGGVNGGTRNEIHDLIFADESIQYIADTLTTATYDSAQVVGASNGYMHGGYQGARTDDIERLVFATETATKVADSTEARYGGVGIQGDKATGYILGGFTTALTAQIEKFVVATETSSDTADSMSAAKYAGAGVSSQTIGYMMGGDQGTYTDTVEKHVFATEIATDSGKNLGAAIGRQLGVYDALTGYAMGGNTGAQQSQIEELVFATETPNVIAAVLTDSRNANEGLGGINSQSKGFFCGGYDGAYKTLCEALTFADETLAALSDVLEAARSAGCGSWY